MTSTDLLDPTTQALREQLAAALVTAKARQADAQKRLSEATKATTAIARALTALGGTPTAKPATTPTEKPAESKPGPRPAAVAKETKVAAGGAK